MAYVFLVLALINLNLLPIANGSPAVPTRWTPGNWNGQVGPGVDLLSIFKNNTLSAHPTAISIPNKTCAIDCTRYPINGEVKSWFPIQITATITAATVYYIVNTKNNVTREVTLTNTEADLSNFTAPTDTNSLGTRTFMVTDVAPDGIGSTTFPVAFPSLYTKYDPQVTYRGTLPTTVSGAPTCLRAANQTSFSFPQHPTLAQTPFLPMRTPKRGFAFEPEKDYYDSQNLRFEQDPKGWTWVPDTGMNGDFAEKVAQFFPNLSIWSCERELGYAVAPATLLNTALYLTHTMTVTEDGDKLLGSTFHISGLEGMVLPASVATQAARLAPSSAEATPTPALAGSPFLSQILSAFGAIKHAPVATPAAQVQGSKQVPAATQAPQAQGALDSEGLHRAGVPVTAPPQMNGLPSHGGGLPIEVGGQAIAPNAQSQYIVFGQTLGIGSSITLGSGASATVVGLQASGSQTELVVGSSTSILSPTVTPTPPLTIGGQVYQADGQGQYDVGGQTLTPGGTINVNGTPISLAPGETQLVVGSSTENLENQLPTETGFDAGSQAGTAFTGMANAKTFSLTVLITVPSLMTALLLL